MQKPFRATITYYEKDGQWTMYVESESKENVAERVKQAVLSAFDWNSRIDAIHVSPIQSHKIWDLDQTN